MTFRDSSKFWSHIDKSGGPDACWPWTGYRTPAGYGRTWNGKNSGPAHRVAWVMSRGDVPDDLCVLHRCDNPACCNPDHLWLGTQRDNSDDKIAKGRYRCGIGERQGNARLTNDIVREIRAIEGMSTRQIGALYGIRGDHVWRIRARKRWAHIE